MENIATQLFADEPVGGGDPAPAPAPVPQPTGTAAAPAPAPVASNYDVDFGQPGEPALAPQQQQAQPGQPGEPAIPATAPEPLPVDLAPAPALSEHQQYLAQQTDLYGDSVVRQAVDMTFGLFGLRQSEDGLPPAADFMRQVWQTSRQAHDQIVETVLAANRDSIIQQLQPEILKSLGLPSDAAALQNLRDYALYGARYNDDLAGREVLAGVPDNLKGAFNRLSETRRNWYIDQVSTGAMPKEVLLEDLTERERVFQREQKEAEAQTEREQQLEQQAEGRAVAASVKAINQWRGSWIGAKAKETGLNERTVSMLATEAQSKVQEFANAYRYGYAENQEQAELGRLGLHVSEKLMEAHKTGDQMQIKFWMNQYRDLADKAFDLALREHKTFMDGLRAKKAAPAADVPKANVPPPARGAEYQVPRQLPTDYRQMQGNQIAQVLFGDEEPASLLR